MLVLGTGNQILHDILEHHPHVVASGLQVQLVEYSANAELENLEIVVMNQRFLCDLDGGSSYHCVVLYSCLLRSWSNHECCMSCLSHQTTLHDKANQRGKRKTPLQSECHSAWSWRCTEDQNVRSRTNGSERLSMLHVTSWMHSRFNMPCDVKLVVFTSSNQSQAPASTSERSVSKNISASEGPDKQRLLGDDDPGLMTNKATECNICLWCALGLETWPNSNHTSLHCVE